MTYKECFEWGRKSLQQCDVSEADLDARLLLEFVCDTDRNALLVHGDREVSKEQQETYTELIEKRSHHIPLQHLTGTQNFMGLDFKVNEHVLIPRQDTEVLVEEVLKYLHDGMHVLDMCTGSGCILISILHYSNDCCGLGVDLSEDALAVAKENAGKFLQEDTDCQFLKSNLFEHVPDGQKFEIIVSNPPYIEQEEIPKLMSEVKDYEPMMALDGGADGLDFYRKIVEKSVSYLCGGGMLFFEIGYNQGNAVMQLMEAAGFSEVQLVKDYAGLDRVVLGTWQ